jgi:hypothetical protein
VTLGRKVRGQPGRAGGRDIDIEAFIGEPSHQGRGEGLVVVDHEQAGHARRLTGS